MVKYIHALQNPNTKTLPNDISVVDVTSPANQNFIE